MLLHLFGGLEQPTIFVLLLVFVVFLTLFATAFSSVRFTKMNTIDTIIK